MIAAVALAATVAACSWDRPGVDPFMGDVPSAVDRYTDIPADIRAALKSRMQRRTYDTVAVITRDEIIAPGGERFGLLRDMHFGNGRVCSEVTRTRWTDDMQERGLVYCEQGHCLIVPTVCRNVSRVTRAMAPPALPPVEIPGGTGLSQQRLATQGEDTAFVPPAKPIPEPSTWLLFVVGLAGILFARWLNKETR